MNKNKHIITQAKRLNLVGKHAGSKPIARLKAAIRRANQIGGTTILNRIKGI